MGLVDRSTALLVAAGAAASSPEVRETLRAGAVKGLAASMTAAEVAAAAARGAWEGARAAAAEGERARQARSSSTS